ncbi:hypothetical protein M011DRAFT_457205 [Sporormia fimetaria CBS 119925]|uniref:Uncharacterized protein n=1 Tax=Sporormia fimetaria CBS 119925 TaxID=1340428 RepID=A0A6A6VFW4_9PLEO|nr:hypothetical protein M011DRAFT_457205 [Sporormia fimetaria CBS 119925]
MSSRSNMANTSQPTIPLFTPPPHCFEDVWAELRPCEGDSSATCTIFWLGHEDELDLRENECMSASVTSTAFPGSLEANCMVSVQRFKYSNTAITGRRSASIGCCVASSPTLSGAPPWTVSISQEGSPSSVLTKTTAVLDPEYDSLLARPVYMAYAVENGITCVPNCQSAYTGPGDRYRRPEEPEPKSESDGCYSSSLCGLGNNFYIVVIVVPLVFVGLGVWCCCMGGRDSDKNCVDFNMKDCKVPEPSHVVFVGGGTLMAYKDKEGILRRHLYKERNR